MNVLVVEDDLSLFECLAALLEGGGHEIYQACCLSQAIRMLAQNSFDVVLSDGHFPAHDNWGSREWGFELVELCLSKGIRAILLTGDDGLYERAMSCDMPAFKKPFDSQALLRAIAVRPVSAHVCHPLDSLKIPPTSGDEPIRHDGR